jgi:hypothetical protein
MARARLHLLMNLPVRATPQGVSLLILPLLLQPADTARADHEQPARNDPC